MGIFADIASLGLGLIGRAETASAEEEANALRLKQEEVAEEIRSTQRTRALNNALATQNADAAARGYTASSPSLFAISADSINQFAQDENADALNLSFDKINAANEDRNIRNREIFGDIGSAIQFGQNVNQGRYSSGDKTVGNYLSPADENAAISAGRAALGEAE